MKKNWTYLNDEELSDEITLAKLGIKELNDTPQLSLKLREKIINQYLEKLKSLYDEQRKRKNA